MRELRGLAVGHRAGYGTVVHYASAGTVDGGVWQDKDEGIHTASIMLLRSRCHRTHHRQYSATCGSACHAPLAHRVLAAPLLRPAVRAMHSPRRPRAEQPRHIDLRSCENPTSSSAGSQSHTSSQSVTDVAAPDRRPAPPATHTRRTVHTAWGPGGRQHPFGFGTHRPCPRRSPGSCGTWCRITGAAIAVVERS